MDSEFPANSQKAKQGQMGKNVEPEEKKKVAPVVTGEVTRRKTPVGKRFKSFFFSENRNVFSHVWFEVIIPSSKDLIVDAGQEALQRAFFGESRSGGRRRAASNNTGFTSYGSYYGGGASRGPVRDEPRELSRRNRSQFNFDELLFNDRVEANAVLDAMYELLSRFEQVTVADFYDASNVPSNFTDNKYGWISLAGSRVESVRNGYVINLPRPEPLVD